MKYLALVTQIMHHPAANARHGADHALKHGRFHFGPAADRAIQSGQILAHRESDGVHVYLVTAGYPVDQDGVGIYEEWCFAVLGISRRKFFAPLRRLRAAMVIQGNGKDAAWALVRASQAATICYHGFPDCHGVEALVDGVGVTASTITTTHGVSVSLALAAPPAVKAGFYRHEDGGIEETLPLSGLGRGFSRSPVTNPNRCARRRLAALA